MSANQTREARCSRCGHPADSHCRTRGCDVFSSGAGGRTLFCPCLHGVVDPVPLAPGMPHAPAVDAREYRCPQCDRWAKWTDGIEESDDDTPDEFWCQTCGAETPIEDMESRPQESAGDANTAGTETDRGTGERGPQKPAQASPVDIAARILVGSDWDDDDAWNDGDGIVSERDRIREWAKGVDDELRPVHYREAENSLRAIATARLDAAPDAIAYARAEGIRIAADIVASTVRGLEDGE